MTFDVVVVLVVLAAIGLGAWKGFAWQLASITALVAGFVVCLPLSKPIAPWFGAAAPLNRFIAMAVLYAAVSLAVYGLALFYRKTIERWRLHHWDHHLGGVMGGVKGFLFCVMLTLFAVLLFAKVRQPVLETRTGRVMAYALDVLHPVWPEEVHKAMHIGDSFDVVLKKGDPSNARLVALVAATAKLDAAKAKEWIGTGDQVLKECVPLHEAEELVRKVKETGGSAEVRKRSRDEEHHDDERGH